MKNNTIGMMLLIMLATFAIASSDLYVPSLPHIVQLLDTTSAMVQLSITGYMLGLSLAPLLFGPLSDRYGRRPMIFLGAGIGLVASLMAMMTPNVMVLIIARFLQAIGLGGVLAITRVVASDLYEGAALAKMAALVSLSVSFGPAIAPVIGGYLHVHYGWRSVFLFIAGSVAMLSLLLYQHLPETASELKPKALQPATMLTNYRTLLSSRVFVANLVAAGLAIGSIVVYAVMSPFILQMTYHLSAVQFGWTMAFVSAMAILSRVLNVVLLRYCRSSQNLLIGLVLMAVGSMVMLLLSLGHFHYMLAVVLPAMLVTLGTGMVPANALVSVMAAFKPISGSVSALYGSLVMLGGFVTTFLASMIPNTLFDMALLLSMMAVSALVLIAWSVRDQRVLVESDLSPTH